MKKGMATHLHYRKCAGKPAVVEACDDQDNVVDTIILPKKDDWGPVLDKYGKLLDRPCPVGLKRLEED